MGKSVLVASTPKIRDVSGSKVYTIPKELAELLELHEGDVPDVTCDAEDRTITLSFDTEADTPPAAGD